MHYVFKNGHVVASHSWAYKEREFNSCHRCQARVNREKWASLPSFYTPLPRLSQLQFGGFFGGGYGRAPALSASPTVTCYWSFKTVWKMSVVVLSRYRFKRSSNFMPRTSTLLAWADVSVGFPSALMSVVALMAFFCSIHSFLCNCGDRMERLDRHLISEGCNTSGKAQCAPYYKNTITYSTSV